MSAVRKTLVVLAVATFMSFGFGGTSHASNCEWWFDGTPFYCDQA